MDARASVTLGAMRKLALVLIATAASADPASHTVKDFYVAGTPSFVYGTGGDAKTTEALKGQAAMIRSVVAPNAPISSDQFATWPSHAIVYGGAHVNRAIATLNLPFEVNAGKLVVDRTFTGDDLALIAVVPADKHHPEFLLYAGTGTPGISEINTVANVDAPITVADAFGPLATGTWVDGKPVLGPNARRLGWRGVDRTVSGATAHFRFWDHQKPAPADDAAIAACERGVATSVAHLGAPGEVTVYLWIDRGSKKELTGNAGDGHAVPFAKALHVLGNIPPAALESLVAHEVTHVLSTQSWGPAGSALLGEGLAVWTAGGYGGLDLDALAHGLAKPPPIAELLGYGFRKLPERTAYSYGGLFVRAAIAKLGLANVRDHLYGATAATWADACKAAGTTPAAMDALLASALK